MRRSSSPAWPRMRATAEAIRATLRAAVPATIKLTDQIQVKEPPPPAPPPRAAPPPTVVPPERAETPAKGTEVANPLAPTPQRNPPRRHRDAAGAAERRPRDRGGKPRSHRHRSAVRPNRGAAGAARNAAKGPEAASPARTDTAAQPPRRLRAVEAGRGAGEACEEQLASVAAAGHILFRLASAELDSASFADARQARRGRQVLPGHAHRGRRPRQLRGQRRDQPAALAQARAIRGSVSRAVRASMRRSWSRSATVRRGPSRPTTAARTWRRTGASNSPSGRSSARPGYETGYGRGTWTISRTSWCGGWWWRSRSAS